LRAPPDPPARPVSLDPRELLARPVLLALTGSPASMVSLVLPVRRVLPELPESPVRRVRPVPPGSRAPRVLPDPRAWTAYLVSTDLLARADPRGHPDPPDPRGSPGLRVPPGQPGRPES